MNRSGINVKTSVVLRNDVLLRRSTEPPYYMKQISPERFQESREIESGYFNLNFILTGNQPLLWRNVKFHTDVKPTLAMT